MVWNVSIGQLRLPGSAPSQPLHTCSSAEHGTLEKVLHFLATTENISVTTILLILNPKHGSYWEENFQDQVGQGSEQPDLVSGVPARCGGFGLDDL